MKKICKLSDITDGDARGFEVVLDSDSVDIVCVRQGQQIFSYKNSCPHTGINLEWLPDKFLDDTQQYFVCSTHGALFQIEDGYCVAGPCQGDKLTSVLTKIEAGEVWCDLS